MNLLQKVSSLLVRGLTFNDVVLERLSTARFILRVDDSLLNQEAT